MSVGIGGGFDGGTALGLAVALGGGLLIGLERERRKGRGGDREAAGIRSFALAGFGGGLAQALGQPLLVALGALAVVALVVLAYRRSLARPGAVDPGLTTELALVVTYLVGVLSVQAPALGGGAAAVVALLLAARERLHRFATQLLSEGELHDALLLAAFALVLLPLLPAEPLPGLGGPAPRKLGLLVLLILALQAAGHVALRLFGARAGLALSGFLSGFVSSTATIASLGARARGEPAARPACEAGALLSTAATWVQALALTAAASPGLVPVLAAPAAAAFVVAAGGGLWRARGAAAVATAPSGHGPLRVREALLVALLLAGVTLAVGWLRERFGTGGVMAGAAIGALADAHASIAAAASLHGGGALAAPTAVLVMLVAVTTNAVTRSATAVVAGGARYGATVALSLAASCAAAWAVALA